MGCKWWEADCHIKKAADTVLNVVDTGVKGAVDLVKDAVDQTKKGLQVGIYDPIKQVGYGIQDGVDELTGKNAMREANNIAKQALADEEKRRQQALLDSRLMSQNRDMQASQMAMSVRRRGTAGAGRSLLGFEDPSTQGDFLGL